MGQLFPQGRIILAKVAQMVKNLPAMQETQVQSPGLGRSPREGNGYPLQYSCLENPMEEETGGLQFMESQRIRHHWVTNTFHFSLWRRNGNYWELGPTHILAFYGGLRTVMACWGVTVRIYGFQDLVEVDLSTILDLVHPNELILCPWAKSFFYLFFKSFF